VFSGRVPPTPSGNSQLSIPTAKVLIWSLRMGAFLREGGTCAWAAVYAMSWGVGGPQEPVCRCMGLEIVLRISWCLVMYGVIVCE
jgi:hypothetical protein